MSSFLVVISSPHALGEATIVFEAGVSAAKALFSYAPTGTIRRANKSVAVFPRPDGTPACSTTDSTSGDFLVIAGQWAHRGQRQDRSLDLLLREYRSIGPDRLAADLEGFYVLIHGDANAELTVVTDVIGSLHCYYRQWPGVVAISDSSSLLASIDNGTLDPIACQEFLNTGVIYEDRTIHTDVRKLGPAGIFSFSEGTLRKRRQYWRLQELKLSPLRGTAAIDALGDTLSQAARKIFSIYQRPVCDLTGGHDSRALIASILAAGMRPTTVVVGPEQSADVRISSVLAELLNLRHIQLNLEPAGTYEEIVDALRFTDGEFDTLEYCKVLKIHRRLAADFDISLNGSFGEVARGYWWELLCPHIGKHQALPADRISRLRFAAAPYCPDLFSLHRRLDLAAHLTEVIKRTNSGLESAPNTLQLDNVYLMMRMQRWQGRIATSTNRIWPCLSPFMFRSVLEAILAADPQLRRRGLLIRSYFQQLDARLARVPLDAGYPPVPFSLRTAPGFWPLVPSYSRKIVAKLLARAGIRLSNSSTSPQDLLRSKLWTDTRVQEMLHPEKMLLAETLDHNALGAFLNSSRTPGFHYTAQWARLLTLELGLRRISEARIATAQMRTQTAGYPLLSSHAETSPEF
jgi:hypothetical protein